MDKHIDQLHSYNEIKDVAQMLMGKLGEMIDVDDESCMISSVHRLMVMVGCVFS